MLFNPSDRKQVIDRIIEDDYKDDDFSNCHFVRVIAKGQRFTKVDFKYTIFEDCYFRNCVFDSCNFIGCKFNKSNLSGSSFLGSKFDYANFDKTFIDDDILDHNCPGYDNVKYRFARNLRKNYQSIGDNEAVNKAIKIELNATESHLYKAWNSNETYYKKKYQKYDIAKMLLKWIKFKILEFIWGNGESLWKLIRFTLLFILLMVIVDVHISGDMMNVSDYITSLGKMPETFFSILKPENYSAIHLSIIYAFRLLVFALFISIIIKRFNRR